MHPPFSSLTERLAGPRSRAWDVTDRAFEMERNGREVIHLGVGDPDLDTPANITDAAIRSLQQGRTHYSPIAGESDLRNAIAEWYARNLQTTVAEGQVTIFPGAQCALFATLLCLAGPGDEVILLEPFYATYEGVARAGGATVVSVPMSARDGFAPNIERIREAISDRTRVIIANSPGNPSGAVFNESLWRALHGLCLEHNIWLVSDEVYASLVFDGQHFCPLQMPDSIDNTVVVSSVSKSYAMTGWRLGWAIAPPLLTAHLENLAQCMLFGVNQFTQDAAGFALRESMPEAIQMWQVFQTRRNTLCNALEAVDQLTIHRPAGGMFVVVDVSRLGIDGESFANRLLDQCGVAVVPGFAFGDSMRDFVRIGYLIDEAELVIAAARINEFVESVAR